MGLVYRMCVHKTVLNNYPFSNRGKILGTSRGTCTRHPYGLGNVSYTAPERCQEVLKGHFYTKFTTCVGIIMISTAVIYTRRQMASIGLNWFNGGHLELTQRFHNMMERTHFVCIDHYIHLLCTTDALTSFFPQI